MNGSERLRRWRANDPDNRGRNRAFRLRHRDKEIDRGRRYRERNKEACRARAQERYQDLIQQRMWAQLRQVAKAAAEISVTEFSNWTDEQVLKEVRHRFEVTAQSLAALAEVVGEACRRGIDLSGVIRNPRLLATLKGIHNGEIDADLAEQFLHKPAFEKLRRLPIAEQRKVAATGAVTLPGVGEVSVGNVGERSAREIVRRHRDGVDDDPAADVMARLTAAIDEAVRVATEALDFTVDERLQAVKQARTALLNARVALNAKASMLSQIVTFLDAAGPQELRQIRRHFANVTELDSLVQMLVEKGAVTQFGNLYQSA